MSDDFALAALAGLTAVVTAYGFVGKRYLDKILDVTDSPVTLDKTDLDIERRRRELAGLGAAALTALILSAVVAVVLLWVGAAAAADMIARGDVGWPKLSVVAVALIWIPTALFIAGRCGRLRRDIRLLAAHQDGRAGNGEDGEP